MVKAKKWVFARKYDGQPEESNFKLEEEELPELKDGEILCEAVYLSVDPYMRLFYNVTEYGVGDIVIGQQVAKVTESKQAEYPVGCLVLVYAGWRTHTIISGNDTSKHRGRDPMIQKISEQVQNFDLSYSLGTLGMPGATAYFCLTDCLKGQLKVKEHRTEGFNKMPQAFVELFRGTNIGKAIIKV